MEAKYDFLQVPQPKNTDRPSVLYPKLVSNGTVTFRELTGRIAESSTFKEGTILGVQEELEKWMDNYELSLSDLWEKNMIGGQL